MLTRRQFIKSTIAGGAGLYLLRPTPAHAAIAFVDAAEAGDASGTSSTLVLNAASQVSTNTGVIVVSIDLINSPTGTVSSVADTASSVWTLKTTGTNVGNSRVEIWGCSSMLGNAVDVTVTLSGAIYTTGSAAYYSGVNAFGITATNSGNSSAPSVALITQDANNYVVGGLTFRTSIGLTWSAGTGTIRAEYDGANSSSAARAQVDNTSASPASTTVSANLSGSEEWAAAAVELRSTAPSSRRPIGPMVFQ